MFYGMEGDYWVDGVIIYGFEDLVFSVGNFEVEEFVKYLVGDVN